MNLFDVPYVGNNTLIIEKKEYGAPVNMPQMHSHSYYEVYFLVSGERRYLIGHKLYHVSPGNLVIIPKDVPHQTIAVSNHGYERYVLYFCDSYISDFITSAGKHAFQNFLESGCLQLPPEYVSQVKKYLAQLLSESTAPDDYSRAAKKNMLLSILLIAMRHGRKKDCEQKNGSEEIQKAALYICENYSHSISLHQVASMVYMDDTYFSKKFKAVAGVGFSEYLMRTRLKAAESMLLSSELSISEIASAAGFSCSNYFGDVFRRFYGVSPSRYRKTFSRP